MLFYLLYLVGSAASLWLPRRVCAWLACRLADYCCWCSPGDREAVRRNLAAVLQIEDVPDSQVREVFRNFGIYLIDFFRFSRLTPQGIRRMVRLEGMEQMRKALEQGKGAIGLTAHLGNFELAGAVFSMCGFPVHAVVLSHQNRRVDDFFVRQRARVGVRGIPIQRQTRRQFFDSCLAVLKNNEILGLVGDRDFFDHGLEMTLFGRPIRVPKGPALFSLRTGAPIVPSFLVRESDGSFRFVLEPPLPIPSGVPKEEAIRQMTQSCLEVMAQYIRRYPTQWYLFQEFWKTVPPLIR